MNYFKEPKYFGSEISFCSLCKIHFLFDDTHALPDTNLCCRVANTLNLGLDNKPYGEHVSMGQPRRFHASGRMNRVIVILDKFRHVYISVRIFESEKFEKAISVRTVSTFHDLTLHIGILQA